MSIRIKNESPSKPRRSPALPIPQQQQRNGRRLNSLSSSPSNNGGFGGVMTTTGNISPSRSSPMEKSSKNYAIFERNTRRNDLLLLHRQQSIDGRRSKQKRLPLPNRSYSLKSRFSSSTGNVNESPSSRRGSSGLDPAAARVNKNEQNTVYFLQNEIMKPMRNGQKNCCCMNNNIEENDDGKCSHQTGGRYGAAGY